MNMAPRHRLLAGLEAEDIFQPLALPGAQLSGSHGGLIQSSEALEFSNCFLMSDGGNYWSYDITWKHHWNVWKTPKSILNFKNHLVNPPTMDLGFWKAAINTLRNSLIWKSWFTKAHTTRSVAPRPPPPRRWPVGPTWWCFMVCRSVPTGWCCCNFAKATKSQHIFRM